MSKPISLLFPPGWTYTTGGANFALPLLKGFLESQNIETHLYDLHIGLSDYLCLKITESDVVSACTHASLDSLNSPYYRSQNDMAEISRSLDATWDIQSGFNYSGCSLSSSEDIRIFSQLSSPFDKYYESHLLPNIQLSTPLIIGISICVPGQIIPAFQIIRFLRKGGYDGKIILGGNLITRLGDAVIKEWIFNLIDGAVLYQGEIALSALYRAIEKGQSWEIIPNLIWKKDGKIIKNKIEFLTPDKFGRPSYKNLPFDSYWGINYLPVLGSRGCYYGKCTFCAIPYAYGNDGFLGHDTPSAVYEDMKNASSSSGLNRYKFMEEALHPAILGKLSDKILGENFACEFEGYARLDNLWQDESFLKKVSKAGLRKVYVGLELINSTKRDLLNKSDSTKAIDFLRKFADVGIKTHVFTLFGYPGTGIDEAIDTIKFVLDNRDLIDTLDIFPFYYAKHTRVPFVNIIEREEHDWTMEYEYEPAVKNVLTMDQTRDLCDQLENLLWDEIPKWLHPTYRLYSPWTTNQGKFREESATSSLTYA